MSAAAARAASLDGIPAEATTAFAAALNVLVPPDARIGAAVSGGPDSLALLLLLAQACPGRVEAASVDHGFRASSADEAAIVAALCRDLNVQHRTLTLDWDEQPASAIQERARSARYIKLADWAKERGRTVLMTAHHADDQAETIVMRLARGAGVTGLAGIRPVTRLGGDGMVLVRPLLGWPKRALEQVCAGAGVTAAVDPSNEDQQFERARVRQALRGLPFLHPQAVAQSASHLADADLALAWAAEREYERAVREEGGRTTLDPSGLPREIIRRLVIRTIATLASEGLGEPIRGRELERLLASLVAGQTATLKGVLCSGGQQWTFAKAPPRTAEATAGRG